jgi:hypothetical protein
MGYHASAAFISRVYGAPYCVKRDIWQGRGLRVIRHPSLTYPRCVRMAELTGRDVVLRVVHSQCWTMFDPATTEELGPPLAVSPHLLTLTPRGSSSSSSSSAGKPPHRLYGAVWWHAALGACSGWCGIGVTGRSSLGFVVACLWGSVWVVRGVASDSVPGLQQHGRREA